MDSRELMKDAAPSLWRTVYYGIGREDGRLLRRSYLNKAAEAEEAMILGHELAAREMLSPRLISVRRSAAGNEK